MDLIPEGHSTGHFNARRYLVDKTSHTGGRSLKLFGRELGGTDFVSLNLYHLASGAPVELFQYTAKSAQFVGGDREIDW